MGLRKPTSRTGFTIVELLIVIVVIGILAAITIVAYGSVSSKANDAKARTNAETIQKVAEAYNAENGTYPSFVLLTTYSGSTRVPSALIYTVAAGTSPATTQNSAVATSGAATTGAGLVDGTNSNNCIGTTTINATCLGSANGVKDTIYVVNGSNSGACIGWYDYSGTVGASSTTQWVYTGKASAAGYASSALSCT